MESTNSVPWYKSTKKTLGVIFAGAVLLGGIYAIYKDSTQTNDVLGIWALFSGSCLGIKAIGGAIQSRNGTNQ